MALEPPSVQPLVFDGKTGELYKIFALNFLLTVCTLGIYHFWGKTRKRRYITSSYILDNDRFEYTGYGSELFWGLVFSLLLLAIFLLPLFWVDDILQEQAPKYENTEQAAHATKYKIHLQDSFNNKLSLEFNSPIDFFYKFNKDEILFIYKKDKLILKTNIELGKMSFYENVQFSPQESPQLAVANLLIILYLVFFFFFLPFVIVYASLRYRLSRLRWRGIRGHLEGSSLYYGLLGLGHTALKFITLGLWIPVADIMMFKQKTKKMYFGNEKAVFQPSYRPLVYAHLATIGAGLYISIAVLLFIFKLAPFLASFMMPKASGLLAGFISEIIVECYIIAVLILLWLCYLPRYWYRAEFFKLKFNHLKFGDIGFSTNVSGWDYFKLFFINDLIFIFTLGFGLPFIWQRRMRFFCQHVQVTGNLKELNILQAPGKKTKFGGGLGAIVNLEIGLI